MNLSVQASQMVIGTCVLPTCLSEVVLRVSEPKALHPVAGVDYPGMYQQLQAWFPDNASCVAFLAELRWGQGFSCPKCSFDQSWQTGAELRMCRARGRKTS
jgi:hypothetical protein